MTISHPDRFRLGAIKPDRSLLTLTMQLEMFYMYL